MFSSGLVNRFSRKKGKEALILAFASFCGVKPLIGDNVFVEVEVVLPKEHFHVDL